MANSNAGSTEPLHSAGQLVDYFRRAGKPASRWMVGTEHELIGVVATGDAAGAAPSYEQDGGIGDLLAAFVRRGWQPVIEGDTTIGLSCKGQSISLEPGGQFEHAASPSVGAADQHGQLDRFRALVEEVSAELSLCWLDIAFRPFGRRADIPWMPKRRYEIMRAYMPTRGSLGLDMMQRTATVQVNLDYADEDDAAAKMRCAFGVTSLLTALYANSPIVDGKVSGYQSYRSHVWSDVDPDRCGLLPFVFDDGDLFESYVGWALDAPMYFVARGDLLVPATSITFRQFIAEGFEGHSATLADWETHLSTLFPEVRLKKYIEIRGCDAGSLPMIKALSTFSRGLLYDRTALDSATALTAGLDLAARQALWSDVAQRGMAAQCGGSKVLDLCRELVAIAVDGVSRIAADELDALEPLREIAESGRTQADRVVDLWSRTSDTASRLAELSTRRP